MNRWIGLPVAVCLLCLSLGCSFYKAPVMPPPGLIFAHYRAPLMVNFKGVDLGSKVGQAKSQHLYVIPLWSPFSIAWGDEAIRQAAQNGGITTVKGADYEFMSVLGFYVEMITYAYGD